MTIALVTIVASRLGATSGRRRENGQTLALQFGNDLGVVRDSLAQQVADRDHSDAACRCRRPARWRMRCSMHQSQAVRERERLTPR